ncbi:MAG TPA: hypothetical protein VJ908_00185, partial [Wenzhouxiangellaceae bacterium]|nr:hypothetical protein [Wenzhouxiangellaceae bacterium]
MADSLEDQLADRQAFTGFRIPNDEFMFAALEHLEVLNARSHQPGLHRCRQLDTVQYQNRFRGGTTDSHPKAGASVWLTVECFAFDSAIRSPSADFAEH